MTCALRSLAAVGLYLALASPALALVFDDGGTHTLPLPPTFENVTVDDGPGGQPTTLILPVGGLADIVTILGSSKVEGLGGSYSEIILRENSTGEWKGGSALGAAALDDATLIVTGGALGTEYGVVIRNQGRIEFHGGTHGRNGTSVEDDASCLIDGVFFRGNSTGVIRAASFDILAYPRFLENSDVVVVGGILPQVWASGTASVLIRGGDAFDDPSVDFQALGTSQITLEGTGFNLPLGDITATSGQVTGTLTDGNGLDRPFQRDATAVIRLTAPVQACTDLLDNDGDGVYDDADPGCDAPGDASERRLPAEGPPLLPCDDGMDNDLDGGTDFDPATFADPSAGVGDIGCDGPGGAKEDPECQDGVNNDPILDPHPGLIDFDGGQSIHGACSGGVCPPGVSDPDQDGVADFDPQCGGGANPRKDREDKSCGLGFELVAVLLPLRAWRRRKRCLAA